MTLMLLLLTPLLMLLLPLVRLVESTDTERLYEGSLWRQKQHGTKQHRRRTRHRVDDDDDGDDKE